MLFREALRSFGGSRRGGMVAATLPGVFADITAPYSTIEAWTYDRFIAPAVAELPERNLSEILDRIPQGAQVLDVGCGGGHALERFLTQFGTGFGDCTRERDTILRGLTMDEILSEIRRTHRRRPNKRMQPTRKKRARR